MPSTSTHPDALPPTPLRTRVAIYVRVSSAAQATEGFSLDAQTRLCETFAA